MINFKPLGARVLVDDIPEKNDGLIKIAPTSKEKPTLMAIVLSIGRDVKYVAVDDVIYRGEWAGQMVCVDNKIYRVMQESDIVGKVADATVRVN